MNTVEAIAHLKNGRTVKAELLPNGGFRFTLPADEEVERFTYRQVQPPVTTWPVHAIQRKSADGDRTAWLRDRFGRLRR